MSDQYPKHSYFLVGVECGPSYALFTKSGIFTVPCGVNRVRVLVVGGGGGGGSGASGGGAAGFVKAGEFGVEPNEIIKVTVGKKRQWLHS